MYLLDTNIWLELLLNQEKAKEVALFLEFIKDSEIYLSSFYLFSICIFLSKLKKFNTLEKFILDISDNNVGIINLNLLEINNLIEIEKMYNLDFNDAFQY